MAGDGWVPPKVWTWSAPSGGKFANINRPVAGATHDKDLPVGRHPLQLYSLGTPNGIKVTVMLEELLAAGHAGAEFDAWMINIGTGEQFGVGLRGGEPAIPKIPALLDRSTSPPTRVFESGAHPPVPGGEVRRLPAGGPRSRATECLELALLADGQCALRQAAASGTSTPTRPEKIEYAINRYAMEAKRQLGRARPAPAPITRTVAGDDDTTHRRHRRAGPTARGARPGRDLRSPASSCPAPNTGT